MTEVFTHPDYGRVDLVRSVLADAGIACEIRGEEKRELIPGMPMPSCDPALHVANEADLPRAKSVVAEFLAAEKQRAESSAGTEWKCAQCGEMVPGNFDSCWKCDALRPCG